MSGALAAVDWGCLTNAQRQRAAALVLVLALWPSLTPGVSGAALARWVVNGS